MVTKEQAQRQLDVWLQASEKVALGQSYSIAGRTMTRVDAAEIRQQIDYWENKVRTAARGGRSMRIGYGVPQ